MAGPGLSSIGTSMTSTPSLTKPLPWRYAGSPQDRGHGFISATVVDPFGNILGIMYNRHYLEILALV